MFERFTDRTHQVVVLADSRLACWATHGLLTAHLLLGVLELRERAERCGSGGRGRSRPRCGPVSTSPPPPPRDTFGSARRRYWSSRCAALQRGHAEIDVRHVLLTLLRDDTGGDAARLLVMADADVMDLGRRSEDSLNSHPPRPGPSAPPE